MRKLAYVLLGILMCVGAFGIFGVRMFGGPDKSNFSRYSTNRGGDVRGSWQRYEPEARSVSRESYGSDRGRGSQARGWKMVEMALDALNVLVGIVGIGLAMMGLRMRRRSMTQSMPLQGKADG